MNASKLFFDQALLPGGWGDDVLIEVAGDGMIGAVRAGAGAVGADARHEIGLPGLPNLHSHTFQRGMAGLTEVAATGDDSFWTWREVMYRFLDRLGPEDVEAIAAQAFVEMLESGFTSVAEFHYLHNAQDGARYADPAELSERIVAAADAAGIGLTLLPVLYANGDFGGAPPTAGQRRFVLNDDELLLLVETVRQRHPNLTLGIAPHSLRAVPPESLRHVIEALPTGPVHIHVAEQEREVEACVAWSGLRPIEWLLANAKVDERWCLIHCTHVTGAEVAALARTSAVVGLCPVTEANLGDGIFPATRLLEHGGRLGVGTDSNVRIDAAAELRLLEYGQRLRDRRRNRLAAPGRSVGGTLYRQAGAGGAQALGQPVGALAPGRRADIVTLDPEHTALVGKGGDALLDAWLFAAGRCPVADVYVGGRLLVRDGRHEGRERVAGRFREVMRRLLS